MKKKTINKDRDKEYQKIMEKMNEYPGVADLLKIYEELPKVLYPQHIRPFYYSRVSDSTNGQIIISVLS